MCAPRQINNEKKCSFCAKKIYKSDMLKLCCGHEFHHSCFYKDFKSILNNPQDGLNTITKIFGMTNCLEVCCPKCCSVVEVKKHFAKMHKNKNDMPRHGGLVPLGLGEPGS